MRTECLSNDNMSQCESRKQLAPKRAAQMRAPTPVAHRCVDLYGSGCIKDVILRTPAQLLRAHVPQTSSTGEQRISVTKELPSIPIIVNTKAIKKHTKLIVGNDVELMKITETLQKEKAAKLAEGQKAAKISKKSK